MKTFLALMFFLFLGGLSPSRLWGEDIQSQWKIDWQKSLFTIELTASLPKDDAVLPINRFKTEKKIQQVLPEKLAQSLFQVRLDSHTAIEDIAQNFPDLFRILADLTVHLTQDFSRASPDYSRISIQFSLPLFPYIAELFPSMNIPDPVPRVISYRATRDFTGVVIYAREPLLIQGTSQKGLLVPSLFPQLWDQAMTAVLSRSMMNPEYLKTWGICAFGYGFSEEDYKNRIGDSPLRITARGLYGQKTTDLILSRQDAELLLSSPANRKLLSEGRVLILLDPEAL